MITSCVSATRSIRPHSKSERYTSVLQTRRPKLTGKSALLTNPEKITSTLKAFSFLLRFRKKPLKCSLTNREADRQGWPDLHT